MTESASTARTDQPFGPKWSAGLRRGSEAELDAWLAFALEAADVADEMARASFRRDLEITTKPDRTHVTQVDRAIERVVRERIEAAWPDHGIVGEEEGVAAAGASLRWYLDPIDGTANFIRGIPLFGFLLAVERDGELQAGVVSMPILGERWYARRGGGAWTVETRAGGSPAPRRVGVSAVAELADAQVVYGAIRDIDAAPSLSGFADLVGGAWRDRGFGDCWSYALVAAGSAEVMLEADVHVWDVAAPAVLIEEAGGRFSDALGERTIHAATALATNGRLHEIALRRLARAGA
jgi:histidinol-phosphatase